MTHEQHIEHIRDLPSHLYAAHQWISAAGEWSDATLDPEQYARDAAANALENEQYDVSECDLLEVIYWRLSHG